MADLTLANSTYQSGTVDTATTLVDNVDTVKAQHPNGANSAIIQIETVLGQSTGLIGNKSDLKTRLNVQMDADGNLCPVGSLLMYGGSAAPTGWLLCDGTAVSRTTYSNLFSVISTTYGTGDGVTTFNVPDLRSRIPIGVGTGIGGGASGTGLPAGGATLNTIARGSWAGQEDLVVPQHSHTITDPGHTHTQESDTFLFNNGGGLSSPGTPDGLGGTGGSTASHTTGITATNNTGVSPTDQNLPPYMGFNFIIRT